MTSKTKRLGNLLSYGVYRIVETALRCMPIRFAYIFGASVGLIAWVFMGHYRRLTCFNLTQAYGDTQLDKKKACKMVKRIFMRLGGNLFCSLKIPWMSEEAVLKCTTIVGEEHLREAHAQGHGIIALASHMGCWELLAQLPNSFAKEIPKGSLYQALSNKRLNQHVLKLRQTKGVQLFDRKSGFYKPTQLIRSGGALAMLADQNAGSRGVWSPFFGKLCSTTPLPAIISQRSGAPIIPVAINTIGIARWQLELFPAIQAEPDESVAQLTARSNQILEQIIRRSPLDWFWVHDRWKQAHGDYLMRAARRGITLPQGVKTSDLTPFRILVRSPNWLGDACMALPAVRALAASRIDSHITILCRPNLVELWQSFGIADDIISLPPKNNIFATIRTLRQQKTFSLAVLFPNSLRSLLEARYSPVMKIAGYSGHARARFLDYIVPERLNKITEHQTHRYLRLVQKLGANIDDIDRLLPTKTIFELKKTDIIRIAICPGAAYGGAKRWPSERFAKIITDIIDQYPNTIIKIVGGANEKNIGDQIEQQLQNRPENSHRISNHIGETSLSGLISIIQSSDCLVSNDTGTMHLAAALGTPTVSIFGSTEPALTRPLGEHHSIIRKHVDCAPCFLRECPLDFRCMTSITSAEVYGALIRNLGLSRKQKELVEKPTI